MQRSHWYIVVAFVLIALLLPILYFLPGHEATRDDPWASIPKRLPHTDHSALMTGPYPDGPSVTRACLACHEDAGKQIMSSSHWTWESMPVELPGHLEPVKLGKKNAINNFCIGITSNWPPCTACHAGYGWLDNTFDFSSEENVDCLVCHDSSGAYTKGMGGLPAEGVDLVTVAKSVGRTSRATCGGCHFRGGGGNAVKHGDLDESLYYPTDRIDVHMGKHDFVCTDCHRTQAHAIKGRAISVSMDDTDQVHCTDCHSEILHADERIASHVRTVACQTCHIPEGAVKEATKMHWDWSQAGQDIPEDPHEYLKIKGKFSYEKDFIPEYYWYDGRAEHYLLGDPIDPSVPTNINKPIGSIHEPNARIWPFKVHRGKQIYDTKYKRLIQPKTYGTGGYWSDFDWDKAARLGSEAVNLPYSGEYGFTETAMYWPTTHMVAEKERALQCVDCHSESGRGRLNWDALGYDGDPMYHGARRMAMRTE